MSQSIHIVFAKRKKTRHKTIIIEEDIEFLLISFNDDNKCLIKENSNKIVFEQLSKKTLDYLKTKQQ